MAILGSYGLMSAKEIVAQSSMDKVRISRAVKKLCASQLLRRDIDGEDRRRSVLRLTPKGAEIFRSLVPQVRAMEKKLLDGLSPEEYDTLKYLMAKVRDNSEALGAPNTPRRKAMING